MLIRFSVRNYKTFKDRADWSLVASSDTTYEDENVVNVPKFGLRLLKSAVVYGANASGKSKLIEALNFMRRFVRSSSKEGQKGDRIEVEPFRLHTLSENEASEFEVIFLYKDEYYRYGFEVTKDNVVSEWLYHRPNTKEVELFYRDKNSIENHPRKFGGIINQLIKGKNIRDNALLLSYAAQFNNAQATSVLEWFDKLGIISGLSVSGYQSYTMGQAENEAHKEEILNLLRQADLDIHDLSVQTLDLNELPETVQKEISDIVEKNKTKTQKPKIYSDVLTTHQKYNQDNQIDSPVPFSMMSDESEGTKKFFALTGPIIDVLSDGSVFIVDELDSRLHPNLVCKIVSLFNSKTLNPNNAQLLFNTHDTNLLSNGGFRRDQIWFTEKDRYGAARLYSLSDFKEAKKKDNFEEKYINGKFGAIPYLGDFTSLIASKKLLEDESI